MLTISNGKEEFIIKNDQLKNHNYFFKGKSLKLKNKSWSIELVFISNESNYFTKIVKCYQEGEEILKEYLNLAPNKSNYILLSDVDFEEIKTIYNNMFKSSDYHKQSIIEAAAIMLSYAYYQSHILELDQNVTLEEAFNYYIEIDTPIYQPYKKEILSKTKEILKNRFNVKL